MEEDEYEQDEDSGGVVAAGDPMEEMVGGIEESVPLETKGGATEEIEGGTPVDVVTMKAGAAIAVGEEEVEQTGEIRPQVVEIENSLEIKGISIEDDENLVETGKIYTFLTPQRKRKKIEYRRRIILEKKN